MTIVVDANIIISAIVNPYGNIPLLIKLYSSLVDFIAPEYAIEEINSYKTKICKAAKIPSQQFDKVLQAILSEILIFSSDEVNSRDIEMAEKLTQSIDSKDTWYIAFVIALDALLWTGDLKLYRELRRKGFYKIVTTKEL